MMLPYNSSPSLGAFEVSRRPCRPTIFAILIIPIVHIGDAPPPPEFVIKSYTQDEVHGI